MSPPPPPDAPKADEFGAGLDFASWDGTNADTDSVAEPASPSAPENTFGNDLAFASWDGSCASCEDPPPSPSDEGAPPVPPAQPPATKAGDDALPAPGLASPPAETEKSETGADKDEQRPMSLMEHLNELRGRIIRIFIVVFLGFFACFSFAQDIFDALVKPLVAVMPKGSKLIYTALPEAFFVQMKIGFLASIFLTSPYIFYQIWAFIAPGLYEEERRNIVPLAGFSAFFFLGGAAFCYFAVFPVAFDFFMGFATDSITPMPSLDSYLSFALKLILAFGLIFEMPLFAFFLARMGVLTAERLRGWRRYAVVTIFIVAAILTPPDVVSQLLMALPMLLLYEISIWVAAAVQKRKTPKDAAEPSADEGAQGAEREKDPA